MNFSRDDKMEAIADLNRAFAEKLGVSDIPPGESRSDILKRIQQLDDEGFSVLASFNNAWLAFDHVRSDKELKIKVEDVWKLEVERHRQAFEESKENMLKLAGERDIDLEPVLLRIKWL